ncbi:hypothetical protein DFP72DRAFT_162371 [Ephemerocybe angulata]|uniref:Uncharacterized protein n=1 Tax=Ephemerocybe angulata TaxID=980116 RepID=A0A8H6I7M3_9AGAR|nr:hypothetical protein DFP72DRAFT_162371 [Tulosesus angulatus]
MLLSFLGLFSGLLIKKEEENDGGWLLKRKDESQTNLPGAFDIKEEEKPNALAFVKDEPNPEQEQELESHSATYAMVKAEPRGHVQLPPRGVTGAQGHFKYEHDNSESDSSQEPSGERHSDADDEDSERGGPPEALAVTRFRFLPTPAESPHSAARTRRLKYEERAEVEVPSTPSRKKDKGKEPVRGHREDSDQEDTRMNRPLAALTLLTPRPTPQKASTSRNTGHANFSLESDDDIFAPKPSSTEKFDSLHPDPVQIPTIKAEWIPDDEMAEASEEPVDVERRLCLLLPNSVLLTWFQSLDAWNVFIGMHTRYLGKYWGDRELERQIVRGVQGTVLNYANESDKIQVACIAVYMSWMYRTAAEPYLEDAPARKPDMILAPKAVHRHWKAMLEGISGRKMIIHIYGGGRTPIPEGTDVVIANVDTAREQHKRMLEEKKRVDRDAQYAVQMAKPRCRKTKEMWVNDIEGLWKDQWLREQPLVSTEWNCVVIDEDGRNRLVDPTTVGSCAVLGLLSDNFILLQGNSQKDSMDEWQMAFALTMRHVSLRQKEIGRGSLRPDEYKPLLSKTVITRDASYWEGVAPLRAERRCKSRKAALALAQFGRKLAKIQFSKDKEVLEEGYPWVEYPEGEELMDMDSD